MPGWSSCCTELTPIPNWELKSPNAEKCNLQVQ